MTPEQSSRLLKAGFTLDQVSAIASMEIEQKAAEDRQDMQYHLLRLHFGLDRIETWLWVLTIVTAFNMLLLMMIATRLLG